MDMSYDEMMDFLETVSGTRRTVYVRQEGTQLIITMSGDHEVVLDAERGNVWLKDGEKTWSSK